MSTAEVGERLEKGLSNRVENAASQSWLQILRRNGLTRINFLLLVLGGATLATGSGPDATFLAVAVINTVVGAVQEARAKRTLDALAVINAPQAESCGNSSWPRSCATWRASSAPTSLARSWK